VLVATVGLIFASQARFADARGADVLLRAALAAASLVVLGHRHGLVAALAVAVAAGLVVYWLRHARTRLAAYRLQAADAPAG
jgi:hypothetical protein